MAYEDIDLNAIKHAFEELSGKLGQLRGLL
jgi:hypothetical protein